jgi:hypothetical protein
MFSYLLLYSLYVIVIVVVIRGGQIVIASLIALHTNNRLGEKGSVREIAGVFVYRRR